MTSDKQIEANRRNARKSTGPQTPEGKAKVAQNAVKHGLLAEHILIQDESQAARQNVDVPPPAALDVTVHGLPEPE